MIKFSRNFSLFLTVCVYAVSASNVFLGAYLLLTYGWRESWPYVSIAVGVVNIVGASVIQRSRKPTGDDNYSKTIEKVSRIVSDLKHLNEFLLSERAKILEVEMTVLRLQKEKDSLEPIVAMHRETVEVLVRSAQGATAWKERFIGAAVGLSTSVIASALYDYFTR